MTMPLIYRPTPATITTDIGATSDGWTAGTQPPLIGITPNSIRQSNARLRRQERRAER